MNLLNTPTYSLIPARVMLVLMSGLAVAYAVLLSIGGWDAGMAGGLALVLAMAAEALERQAVTAQRPLPAGRWRAAKIAGLVVSGTLLAAAWYARWAA